MITKVEGTNQIKGFNDVVLVALDYTTKQKRRTKMVKSKVLIMGPYPLCFKRN